MVYVVAVVAYSQPGAWLCYYYAGRPPTLYSLPSVYPSVSLYYTVCPKEIQIILRLFLVITRLRN